MKAAILGVTFVPLPQDILDDLKVDLGVPISRHLRDRCRSSGIPNPHLRTYPVNAFVQLVAKPGAEMQGSLLLPPWAETTCPHLICAAKRKRIAFNPMADLEKVEESGDVRR
jgi:hypothetical protein